MELAPLKLGTQEMSRLWCIPTPGGMARPNQVPAVHSRSRGQNAIAYPQNGFLVNMGMLYIPDLKNATGWPRYLRKLTGFIVDNNTLYRIA